MPQSIDSILDAAEQQQASDVFLREDEVPHAALPECERVADTMERYVNLFPAEDAKHGVTLLANQLSGVLCQKLVESADGGLHLLVEHVENAGAMRDWIARRELQNIDQYISRGSDPAAVSFLQSTVKALQAKIMTEAATIASVSNESELRRAIRGISWLVPARF
jgi:twitching motility protein PilT